MNTRRRFLITAPLGIVGATIGCKHEAPASSGPGPSTPGAPPTFATAPAVGPEISPATFAEAEKLAQVTMDDAERQMAAASWRRSMAPLLERRTGPRKVALAAGRRAGDALESGAVWRDAGPLATRSCAA